MITFLCCSFDSACVADWAQIVMAAMALFSFFYVLFEYKKRKKYECNEVLMKYNERYETSGYIQKIVVYYSNRNDKNWTKPELEPTVNDRELFLRFFEELESMVESGYININRVADMFSYYFIVAWNDEWFWNEPMLNPYKSMEEVHKSTDWPKAKRFYERLKCLSIHQSALSFLEQCKKERAESSLS